MRWHAARSLCTWASVVDHHRLMPLVVMLLAAMTINAYPLSQPPQLPLAEQLKGLNPDAKLYWGLSQNLLDGTGFYDKLIPTLNVTTRKVALAFECQIVSQIPMEPHDRYIDIIITEKRIIYKL